MQTAAQIRDHLRAFVDRERSARIARLQRDLNPPRAPLIGDWPTLMEKREREYRIFGRLQTLAAEEGFDAGYDSELDGRLKREGFSLSERGAIRRRIENGYLRDLGRPDETGRLTPPRAYLQTMLTSMNEPLTEAGLNRCLRGLAALSGHVSREFASTYAEARADPREAWANLSAMRARGEMPRDTLGWAASDFDGADSFEWGDFEVQAPTTPPLSESSYTDPATPKSEPVGQPAPEQDPIADRKHPPAAPAPASYPSKTEAAAPEEASRPSSGSSELDGEDRGPAVTDCAPALDQRGLDHAHEDSEAGSGPVKNSLTEMVEELITHKGATWDEKTQRQHRAVAAMLGDVAGTDDLRQIRHAHLAAYIQNLSNLPKSYGKSSRDAALSIADLVERGRTMRAAGQTEKVGLSPATVNRHITQLSTIAKYCRAKQRPIGQVELLSDFRLIDPERDGEKRPAFEVDEIKTLFAHPVWTSTASEAEMLRVARGQQIFAVVYWLPLLGYYTCARLSELVYLELGDIDLEQATLKIRPTRRRRLKNAVSRRTLPLHPELIRLGFLDYVRGRSGARSDLIFAEIAKFGENTPLSNLFDKRWTVVLDEAVPLAREERKTFHSFRHFGNTEMIRRLVLDPIRESMMGHEGATVNSRNYKKTLKPEDLQTAIAAIPEVTRGLRACDWTLIESSLTLGSLERQVSAEGSWSRRRYLPSSSPHSARKDAAKGPKRSSPHTEACPRRNQKPFKVP
ncbi:tyrosine-type recombinase/integrase [Methylobacterium sp. WL116]|uniref:tyrosine-type recombinase/integrase n=1 Tax=Methylobacterium sp. WL116 TaxID=2603889 RepID=UPI0011CA9C9D|nr:tyrosine-type recombinase/integrase [Methylobacterium sp. WL116]TXM91946.1 tyrosine-type recombinase/integrase [Methylobacterium sp. WL116]